MQQSCLCHQQTVMGGNSKMNSIGTLGNVQIMLIILQQGYSILVLEVQHTSGFVFMYGSSENLKCFPYGIALNNLIWFQLGPFICQGVQKPSGLIISMIEKCSHCDRNLLLLRFTQCCVVWLAYPCHLIEVYGSATVYLQLVFKGNTIILQY